MMKIKATVSFCVTFFFVACGSPSPEDYVLQAREAEKARNFSGAIENYSKVIESFPYDPMAEEAAFKIAVLHNNETQDYQAAVDWYKRYSNMFPEGSNVATAMFLTGYLYHNELSNLDSARAAYTRFLDRFPDHEMALSAHFELENLGRSPDEFLPKPEVAATNGKATPTKRSK